MAQTVAPVQRPNTAAAVNEAIVAPIALQMRIAIGQSLKRMLLSLRVRRAPDAQATLAAKPPAAALKKRSDSRAIPGNEPRAGSRPGARGTSLRSPVGEKSQARSGLVTARSTACSSPSPSLELSHQTAAFFTGQGRSAPASSRLAARPSVGW